MGEVLLALDTRLDRKVAIKRILGEAARSKTAVSRFLTEAKAIAALNHPNVVQIYDYGRASDGPFLIMEYVDGSSLLDRCRDGALPLEQAVDLACQLCDGLAKAHDLGIVHRDIKPANVLLTKDGLPKLTDFGLAKAEAADHQMTMTGAVLGTPDFMPPEQRKDAALVDHRSDLWSLAATLYQMVTGRSPKIIRFDLLPPGLTSVLGKALEELKDDRYQSAREFRDALKTSLVASAPAAAELGEGQCPACGVKNESSRRFCRGCGEALEAPCLSCSKPMPMWEEICGQCGTKQASLLENRRGEMAARQAEAEGLLKVYDFDQAERITVSLRDESDLRLKHLVPWATDFVAKIGKAREAQLAQAGERLTEALKHEASFDYPSAIHALEQVPEILRNQSLASQTESVANALFRVEAKQSSVESLESCIKERIATRELGGLLPKAEKLRELRPDRADVEKLCEQLREREQKLATQRDDAVRLAHGYLEAKDYESVIAVLRKVDRSVETPELSQLRDAADINLKSLQNLLREISVAVSLKQLDELMPKVQAALALKPEHAELTKLRASLEAREARAEAGIQELLNKADTAFKACQFDKGAALLQRVPEDRRNSEVTHLLEECEYLAMTRAGVLAGFEGLAKVSDLAMAEGVNLKPLAVQGRSYLGQIAEHGLSEPLIEQWCVKCEAAHEKREAAAEEARRAAAMLRRVFIGVGAAAAVILLTAVGFWARSSWRAAAIEAALARSDWQAALTLDPDNVDATIGQAKAKLSSNPADIDGAFAALDRAENLAPSRGDIKTLRGAAYATRAISHSHSDRLSEAGKDIADATRATAEANLLRAAKDVVAAAWLTRVVKHAKAGRISDADAALKQAERFTDDEPALTAGKAAIATAWLNHAVNEAKDGRLDEAENDLAEARRYGADDQMTRPLFEIVTAAWADKAQAAIDTKKSADALAAISSARKFGAAEQTVSPLVAGVMMLDAAEQYSREDLQSAVSTVANAFSVNATVAEKTLALPENLKLRQVMMADYRSKFDAARSDSDWEGAVRIATEAARLDETAAGLLETVISELPPAVLASLPREAFAGLTTITENFDKSSSGLYSRAGDPRVNGVESQGGVSFFRMTSGRDKVIARGEPYAVYFPILFSPTDSKTVEVSFRCRRFVRTPEGDKSFLAVEFVDSKADVNAALAGSRLGQRVTLYNNDRFSLQLNGYAVIGVTDGRGGSDAHVPCDNQEEWMKVTLWLHRGSAKQKPIIGLWTFVNGLRPNDLLGWKAQGRDRVPLMPRVLAGDKDEQLPEHLGICFIAYGSKTMNSFGQREPVLGEATGCIYDIADVAFRVIDPPTRAAESIEECLIPK